MEVPLSELIDRFSILRIKYEHSHPHSHPSDADELTVYGEALYSSNCDEELYYQWLIRLEEVNSAIWDLESDIRLGKEGILGLEEVGRRALAIRDLNRQRIAIKNEIATYCQTYLETKVDHASS